MLIGPFFYIRGKLICNTCTLSEGREQAGKLDNSYGHDRLYDDNFNVGDYIDYPRGRVIWNGEKEEAIIYIDPCINNQKVIDEIISAFELDKFAVEYDDHYHCRKCVGDLFDL